MSTVKNSPDTSEEYPEPTTGRFFVPVGQDVSNDHEARKRAHPAQAQTQVQHSVHPYTYAPGHGRNYSFQTKGPRKR